jgi:5-methylcytosine-specific restriction endonuclease McrA
MGFLAEGILLLMNSAKRSKPIRHRSKKREKLYRTSRRQLVAEMLASNPRCKRCKRNPSQDVHEIKSRARGGSITDPDNCVALCRTCHTFITQNPAIAHEEGWSKHSWE